MLFLSAAGKVMAQRAAQNPPLYTGNPDFRHKNGRRVRI
jgi:hypothetical protein